MSISFMNAIAHFFRKNLLIYAFITVGYFLIFGSQKMNPFLANDHFFGFVFFPTFFAGCVAWAVHTMRNIESE